MSLGQELLNVPMGQMIRDMAFAIADAQVELDEASMKVAEMMSGQVMTLSENGYPVNASGTELTGPSPTNAHTQDTRVFFGFTVNPLGERVPVKVSMLELGFAPTFYQFVDTIIEVKIAIKITVESQYTQNSSTTFNTQKKKGLFKRNTTVQTSQVDATYSRKYTYSAEGSSLLRTKLVPVPPPGILEERIRAIMDLERALRNPPPPPPPPPAN
jgi:hypothetical protein